MPVQIECQGKLAVLRFLVIIWRSVSRLRNNEVMEQVIVRDPEIMHGTPVFRGTRVPVQTLFEYLEGGETLEDFLLGFRTVSRDAALQALEEAKQLLLARP